MTPGIHDISNEEYHGGPGLSSSALKLLAENPQRFDWEYNQGNRREETQTLIGGSLLHDLILEPNLLTKEFAIAPKVDRRTNKGKERWAEFVAKVEANGQRIVTANDFDLIVGMTDAVLMHPMARRLLEGAVCEQSIYWHEGDVLAKCRPDAMRLDLDTCADLKSTVSAHPKAFNNQAVRLKYHLSAAWYLRGIEAEFGERPGTWAWIAVEKEPPHPVVVYVADDALLAKGDELCEQALDRYRECQETGHWPPYTDHIEVLTLPNWAA